MMDPTEKTNQNDTPTSLQRIRRHCPKLKDIEFDLECEWNDCNSHFIDIDHFLDHIEGHLRSVQFEQILECKWNECDHESFENEGSFRRHVKFHGFHSKLKQIGCAVLRSFSDNQKKKESSHPMQDTPKCNLDEQTRNEIPDLPLEFQCSWDKCGHSTDDPELFYRHIRVHVDNYPKKLLNSKCKWSDCDQIIQNKSRFAEHIRHHSQEKIVSCPNCGALFSSFTKFIDHCSRSTEIGRLCFQCSHCNKKFSSNNLLKDHIRKHVNKCKCPICDMTCIDKNDLSKHILYKHTEYKAFKCNFCEHASKTDLDLQKHIKLKHSERFEYQCDECDFKTKDINSIKRHILKTHQNADKTISLSDRQNFSNCYMCHVCCKVYSQGATLSRHLKIKHDLQWPSGHSRFRYKLEADGYYRLQTLRYESLEIFEQLKNNSSIETPANFDCVSLPTTSDINSNMFSCNEQTSNDQKDAGNEMSKQLMNNEQSFPTESLSCFKQSWNEWISGHDKKDSENQFELNNDINESFLVGLPNNITDRTNPEPDKTRTNNFLDISGFI